MRNGTPWFFSYSLTQCLLIRYLLTSNYSVFFCNTDEQDHKLYSLSCRVRHTCLNKFADVPSVIQLWLKQYRPRINRVMTVSNLAKPRGRVPTFARIHVPPRRTAFSINPRQKIAAKNITKRLCNTRRFISVWRNTHRRSDTQSIFRSYEHVTSVRNNSLDPSFFSPLSLPYPFSTSPRSRSFRRSERGSASLGRFADASLRDGLSFSSSHSLSFFLSLLVYRLQEQHTVPVPYRSCCWDSIAEHTWTRFVF